MAQGTEKEIFDSFKTTGIRRKTNGRPRIDRRLGYRLLMAPSSKGKPYSNSYIRSQMKCTNRSIKKMRREIRDVIKLRKEGRAVEDIALELGLLEDEVELVLNLTKDPSIIDLEKLDKLALDFDDECIRAMGYSFKEWLQSQRKSWKTVFNFCKKVWETIWDKPPLVIVKDRDDPLGDRLCLKFLEVMADDTTKGRARQRIFKIRRLFDFLGRNDLNKKHLRTPEQKYPRSVREVQEITMISFPESFSKICNAIYEEYGVEGLALIQLKTSQQMRTGSKKKESDIFGLTIGEGKSWIILEKSDKGIQFRSKIFSKMGEEWYLPFISDPILNNLYEIYSKREYGEYLFQIDRLEFTNFFGDVSKKILGRRLRLHDLRKVSITWYWVLGVPLEDACRIGVGWKKLDTVKKHYLMFRKLIKKSEKKEYREKIPLWFKQGLEEFLE